MNAGLVTAAAILVFIGGVHSYLGERYILMRLFRRDDLPRLFGSDWFTRRTLRFAWHITSVAWLGFAAILVLMASPEPAGADSLLAVVAATFFVSGLISLAASRGRHLSWVAFFAIAALCWLAR